MVWTTNAHILGSRGVLGDAWKQVTAQGRMAFWLRNGDPQGHSGLSILKGR
jgi:hypothetical protein